MSGGERGRGMEEEREEEVEDDGWKRKRERKDDMFNV